MDPDLGVADEQEAEMTRPPGDADSCIAMTSPEGADAYEGRGKHLRVFVVEHEDKKQVEEPVSIALLIDEELDRLSDLFALTLEELLVSESNRPGSDSIKLANAMRAYESTEVLSLEAE